MKKITKKIATSAIVSCMALISVGLVGCSSTTTVKKPTGDYQSEDVGKINKVVPGVILSERIVNVYGKTSTLNEEADMTRKTGHEYVIRLDTGAIVSLVQTEELNLRPKQHILVIYGSQTRIVLDEGAEG